MQKITAMRLLFLGPTAVKKTDLGRRDRRQTWEGETEEDCKQNHYPS